MTKFNLISRLHTSKNSTLKKSFSTLLNSKFNILLLGAPGVGKGTYGRFITKDFNLPVLSSGDELRKVLSGADGENNSELRKTLKEGKLAGDEFMFNFMKERLAKPEYKNGVILDGYPRNPKQALDLEKLVKVNLVIKIDLNEEILTQKLLGRRVCKGCGRNYNIYSIYTEKYDLDPLLPKKDQNKCDDCDSDLYQREDDNINTIKDRLHLYNNVSKPLEKHYEDQNILFTFEMRRGIKDYYMIKDFINDWRKLNNFQ